MRAIWNGAIIAESSDTIVIEGNHYFPPESVRRDYLKANASHTACPWKGEASYYDIEVRGSVNPDAAWHYPKPTAEAERIRGYIAFWRGVEVTG